MNKPAFLKNKPALIVFSVVVVLGIAALGYWLLAPKKIAEVNPAFSKYIDAYTSGVISKQGSIRIQLASDVSTLHTSNEPEEKELFQFSPSIKGKTYWVDARTLEFHPDEDLEPGKLYDASFSLSKLTDVPEDLKDFKFQFQVIEPSFRVEQDGLKSSTSNSLDRMKLTGTILLSDSEDPVKVEKLLKADYQGSKLNIRWSHNPADHSSRFTIDSILKGKQEKDLTLTWDGDAIKSEVKGSKTVKVPAIGVFKILDIKAIQEPEQYVLVQFSEPVLVAQDLNGLIGVSTITDLHYTIDGSEVKVYGPDHLEGNYTVAVNEGIENIDSRKITKSMSANVNFENRMPSVTIPGKGIILPSSGKLTFPFEAINLKAVDVTIIQIYENNIPQYFQVNDMNGGEELRRVAKPVVRKTIRLDADKALNLKRKNRFSLDIDKLLRTEPGAIYRITIGFRKSYSLYTCDEKEAEEENNSSNQYGNEESKLEDDDDFWSLYDNYYPYEFEWDQKDDPCNDSYYTQERWATRNVLASNIGLIAKRGNNNSMLIAVTDILSTQPMSGVELQLLDFQQQVLQTITTDKDGLASADITRKPALLIARKGTQRGYLKLDDGSSLPLSRFNVAGDVIQSGIKGFLYGERGVWRPGDSVFVGFILEDKGRKLPKDNPVIFEFYNPQGQLNKRIIQTKSLNGFYTFRVATEPGAPTGNWQAKVKVGGAVFEKSVKIETIMPNRIKINLDFGGKKELVKGSATSGTLTAKWLFGATAQNLKAKIDATLSPGTTEFKKFPKYTFDDPTSTFKTENKTVFDGQLNADGVAVINADMSASESAPGVLRANFFTKVFEPGGNFSIDNFSLPYHVYNSYAGIRLPEGDKLSGMLFTDRDYMVDIANVNAGGNLLSGQRKVQVEFYKIQWRWWWDEGEENLSNFTQDRYNQLLKKEIITLNNGSGKWKLRIDQPDWGRYLIRVKDLESGHTTGQTAYIDWPGWQQREQQNSPTEASMLSFTSNKESYKVGEDVTLTIPSSKGGRGLVSIESGSKVLKTWWVETQKGQTKFNFKVEKEMAPNVYVNVTLLQPHAQTKNDLPIRMYGVLPILVEDPQTILKPVISMPAVLRPETKSSLTISESSGKAMTYTIAIVDEGLLDLTRFKTPDPHSSFYAREALGVKTWDLFDYVIGAWGGDLERILSIGGDGNINRNIDPAKANRFKPVVKFLGPFYIAKGEKKTHSFKLPQYIGSVRAMVIAGHEGAYGFTEKSVQVKKPLMILATLPRVAGPGETFKLPITVFAMESQIKNVKLEVRTNGLLTSSGGNQSISFSQPGEKMIYADINVKDMVGIAKVKIIARSGNEKAEYDVELSIRNPNPYITSVTGSEIEPARSFTTAISPLGTGGTNSGMIEMSSIPPMNLTQRLNYLIQYPHGCVEQTTSSVFPQLVLNQLTDLSGQQKVAVERNIKAGINRLKGFQTIDGGLSYWPGDGQSDEWGTNYAGHFMLEAQSKGYSLPVGFLDQWKRYQKNKAVAWTPNTTNFYGGDLMQSYRLYLLAMIKAPEVGAMNRLKEFQYLSNEAKWRLAAAYKMIGQAEVARGLIRGLRTDVKPYTQLGGTFGSDLRDQAMILETLTEMGRGADASKLLGPIALKLSRDDWYSTQTTAYALIAIAKYTGQNKSGAKMNFTYSLNGIKKAVSSATVLTRIPLDYKTASGSFTATNKGNNRLYVRVIRQGQAPPGQNPPIKNDPQVLDMSVVYKTLNGKLVDPASLKQGTDFVAEVTVRNPGNHGYYEQMALTQIFPSGWEIINTRLNDNDGAITSSPYSYRDIRDDRVFTYYNIRERETLTYQVLLNASYLGRYYLPATSNEAMYDHLISATVEGKWVVVEK
jgi:alpha-2-macroglobulin